jgi:hypothetical protein
LRGRVDLVVVLAVRENAILQRARVQKTGWGYQPPASIAFARDDGELPLVGPRGLGFQLSIIMSNEPR